MTFDLFADFGIGGHVAIVTDTRSALTPLRLQQR